MSRNTVFTFRHPQTVFRLQEEDDPFEEEDDDDFDEDDDDAGEGEGDEEEDPDPEKWQVSPGLPRDANSRGYLDFAGRMYL